MHAYCEEEFEFKTEFTEIVLLNSLTAFSYTRKPKEESREVSLQKAISMHLGLGEAHDVFLFTFFRFTRIANSAQFITVSLCVVIVHASILRLFVVPIIRHNCRMSRL